MVDRGGKQLGENSYWFVKDVVRVIRGIIETAQTKPMGRHLGERLGIVAVICPFIVIRGVQYVAKPGLAVKLLGVDEERSKAHAHREPSQAVGGLVKDPRQRRVVVIVQGERQEIEHHGRNKDGVGALLIKRLGQSAVEAANRKGLLVVLCDSAGRYRVGRGIMWAGIGLVHVAQMTGRHGQRHVEEIWAGSCRG